MKVEKRGRKLGLTVEPLKGNITLAREIPVPLKWSGNVALFDPRPEAIEYLAKTWPNLEGLDKIAANVALPKCTPSKQFKTKLTPFDHQKEAFKAGWSKRAFAYLMEMGTGKTYVALLNAAWLAHKGQLNGLLIIAPEGIHRKWINKEMPKFWPDGVPYKAAFWKASARKAEREAVEDVLNYTDGMAILAINVEALSSSEEARKVARGFLKARVAMCAVDESTDIKTPGAKRSRQVVNLGKLAKYRRILTGSPGLPTEIYGQFAFLGKECLGYETFEAFKYDFAVMVPVMKRDGKPLMQYGKEVMTIAKDNKGKPMFRNVDRLRELMAPYCFRVTKAECFDLPPKVPMGVPVKMTPEQWKHYKEIAQECYTEFHGRGIDATLAIQKLVRLRQVVSGWLPISGDEVRPIGKTNLKIERIVRLLAETQGKVVLWGNFKHECRALVEAIAKAYPDEKIARYWGEVDADEREQGYNDFQEGDARFFVGNPQCGGRGIDLFAASNMIFMSNGFSWEKREQAEDRIHRNGQEAEKLTYLDVYAEGTIDEYIMSMLHAKKEICQEVTGDQLIEIAARPLW